MLKWLAGSTSELFSPMPSLENNSACYLSRGIGRIRILAATLTEYDHLILARTPPSKASAVLGWGLKPTSIPARKKAQQKGLSYVSLEDGFLRSWGLGVDGYQPHSLVVDHRGIYYDATRPSDLENLIQSANFDELTINRARQCITTLRQLRLSKYNQAPDIQIHQSSQRPTVLVVDQTFDDASVLYGGATQHTFLAMLESAISENPEAEVLVKVHPDVIAGKKKGYLLDAATHTNCRILAEDINPWALFDAASRVYVVTSQMGFEALFAGLPVTCFGQPFYSGWGLTDDRQPVPRRSRQCSLEQVFAAAYIAYARYANPYTGQRCELEDTINLIADQKRQIERLSGAWLGFGFSRWKQRYIKRFLGPRATITFANKSCTSAPNDSKAIWWASKLRKSNTAHSPTATETTWQMEDGFVRSVGLGVDLATPLSLIVDSQGIYYDATRPCDLETLLETHTFPTNLLERAQKIRNQLIEAGVSKYNVGTRQTLVLPQDRRLVLVPGQVESDASIAMSSPQLKTNRELLTTVRARHPDAYIIYKPHPDVQSGGRIGELATDSAHLYDLLITDIAMPDLLGQVHEVHTLCSLTGFEALLRDLPVFTYGLPFYAGWGLTCDLLSTPRRTRKLSLDQLVVATLILYPTYVDPNSGQICNIETAIDLIAQRRKQTTAPSLKTLLYRYYRRLFEGRR